MNRSLILLLIGIIVLTISSCGNKEQKWEYTTYTVKMNRGYEFGTNYFPHYEITDSLDKLGEDGWEVVESYTEVETVHPNFGNEKYVTGLQPNTRTSRISFILKRPKRKGATKPYDPERPIEVDPLTEIKDTTVAVEGD